MSEEIKHYGVKRRSGRYPWGSGEDPQRSRDFLSEVDELSLKGLSEKEIASKLGMNTSELRNKKAWANEVRKNVLMDSIKSRSERGDSNTKIANDLGVAESTVRNYKNKQDQVRTKQIDNVTDTLRNSVEDHEYLDVGVGVERQMGISRAKLKASIAKLKEEGYVEHEIYVRRLTDPSKYTTVKVLTKEKDYKIVRDNSDKIRPVESWTDDGGLTFQKMGPVKPVGWDRLGIRYGDKGGADMDGIIELRRGSTDLDLGGKMYAQVRIQVGDGHYLKGMAIYSDNLPDGVDMMFNTNKKSGTPKTKVLKELKKRQDGTINTDNPFGARIARQRGALNIVREEGDWADWSSKLSSQVLSKQPTKLVKERMGATFKKLEMDYDEISRLTNPAVKKHLLEAYANELDSKARHLKAQGLPRSKNHVLLPFPDMKTNEIYAPGYRDGERVALIRYPHGGIFEIPELTVNNRGPAKGVIQNAIDAVGIHPSVASKLSGADFDGDFVTLIPNNSKKIKTGRSLKELKNFDPQMYKTDSPVKIRTQTQMGLTSNLITDMTIKGASQSELARAVKHSMVVIDAEKHNLDYKASARDNAISALTKKYQGHKSPKTGKQSTAASTIVSRSKKKDRKTKKYLLDEIYERDGNVNALSSGTAVESVYVNYVHKVKGLNAKVRKEAQSIPSIKRNPRAAKVYDKEVKSLDSKLNRALLNAPKERQAQILASNTYYKNLNYDMTRDQKKKLRAQALAGARSKVNAKKKMVEVTPKEWEAIQSGAISNNKLKLILNNTKMDDIKKLATPKTNTKLSTAKASRAKSLMRSGKYTQAEIAASIGISVSALRDLVNE